MLAELLEKAGEGDFLRAVAEAVLQLLMESDVEGVIGAGRYERSGERSTWRNGRTLTRELIAGVIEAGLGQIERPAKVRGAKGKSVGYLPDGVGVVDGFMLPADLGGVVEP